jgi:hypothetical protein
MLNYANKSLRWLRGTARRFEITRLLQVPLYAKRLFRRAAYRIHPRSTIEVRIRGTTAKFLVSDDFEWGRILTYKDDRKLIYSLLERVGPHDVFWDIGASIGLYSIIVGCAETNARIVSF